MTIAPAAEPARLQHHARWLAMAATLAIAAVLAFLTLTLLVAPRWRGHPDALLGLALTWSPAMAYLWGLWTLRGMFAALARPGGAQPTITAALVRLGAALLAGAVLTMLTAPLIQALDSHHRLGWFAAANVPALTIALVGLALILLARLLKRLILIEAEAQSLKDVLEGFI